MTQPDPGPHPEHDDLTAREQYGVDDVDERTGKAAAALRIENQHQWVDQQVRVAMERGDFDDLPGAGKPIKGLGGTHDPDWWVKSLVEREQITGVLPPSLQLRKEDAELDDRLADVVAESDVRRQLADFNERVVRARYSLTPGPPLVTMPRDVEETVERWRETRAARREAAFARARTERVEEPRRRWWQRRRTA